MLPHVIYGLAGGRAVILHRLAQAVLCRYLTLAFRLAQPDSALRPPHSALPKGGRG